MLSVHNVYQNGKAVDHIDFDVSENESAGTQKLIDLSGPVFDTLSDGGVLIVDELDAKLHPILTLEFVRLFHNAETNPLNAQLVFATHDTNLLSHGNLRRDQIFFIEKDECEQSDLYSLVDYDLPEGKKVRKDMSFEKDYLLGRYGAIPFLGPETILPLIEKHGEKNQD